MQITTETATVYRGGGRRWFTRKAAVYAEAFAIIKRKHPSERSDPDCGGGFHWRDMPRSEVLLRRVMRLVNQASKGASHAE